MAFPFIKQAVLHIYETTLPASLHLSCINLLI